MLSLDDIEKLGSNLNRPECVLTTSNGRIYTASFNGGINIIEQDGFQWELLAKGLDFDLKPNGICLMPDGSILAAHLGDDQGGVYQIAENGVTTPFCVEVEGSPLPPTNYVHLDSNGRVWITISTRKIPRALGYNPNIADGFIVLVENGIARIVAENLGYTNECLVSPDGKKLFVNETFSKRLISYDITENGNLENKALVAEFGLGTFPDGLTFDTKDGIWITSIVSNRLIRIDIHGNQEIIIEDSDLDKLKWVEEAFQAGKMGRPHLDNYFGKKLKNISSFAFGGEDLNLGYLGCLLDDCIYKITTEYRGHPPTHWNFNGPRREASQ
ncbi:SMP-30/gluconolactonase/LRE family protein [Curvivirga sp.]|uniref:SMP-30/gluconolactonase/LRE family protein n=1 Tax=Curvivirga sp. TaxID=2856848 RepID=UPI003B5CC047